MDVGPPLEPIPRSPVRLYPPLTPPATLAFATAEVLQENGGLRFYYNEPYTMSCKRD